MGFGYIMPLREARFKSIISLMKRRIHPTFRVLTAVGFQMADSYLQLHARGLCYRDISYNNIHFDPDTAAIRIGDNDNIAVDNHTRGGILGTPRFMAPELVRGEAVSSTQTDLFSLAVLLFYIFVIHHPLEGKKERAIRCFDLPAMNKLYGLEPLFIFNPNDHSNAPVPGEQPNPIAFWPIYPAFLHDLFTRAFTNGIDDPNNGRVREGEWRSAMVKLSDSIVLCANCGAENFYDASIRQTAGVQPGVCWSCSRAIILPPLLRIGQNILILNRDTQVFPHHIDVQKQYDFSQPIGEVTRHPTDPHLWGLKNLSEEKWTAIAPDGTLAEVLPGRNLRLKIGTRIDFGKVEGQIRQD
jgi:eukaryotic-like serine/threonine-protein kinase